MPKRGYRPTPETLEKMRQAQLGRRHSPEAREKIRRAQLGNKHSFGCKRSPETLERMRQAQLGRFANPEERERMRQAALRRKPYSAETREKMSQAHLGKKLSAALRQKKQQAHLRPEAREKHRQARLRRKFPLTSIERLLRDEFRKRRLKFEMHKAMFGRFQPDFTFENAKLFVQADGGYWHNRRNPRNAKSVALDDAFNAKAAAEGWTVFRFSDTQIKSDAAACARAVARFVRDHKAAPSYT